jgi:hypothetical protein
VFVSGSRAASQIIQTAPPVDLGALLQRNGICPVAQAEVVAGAVFEGQLGARGAASVSGKLDAGTARARLTARGLKWPRFDARVTHGAGSEFELPFIKAGDSVGREVPVGTLTQGPAPWRHNEENFVGFAAGGALLLGANARAGAFVGPGCASNC